jgi:hypothetical protein
MQQKNNSRFLVTTTDHQQLDLTNARELRSNNLYPFGRHNYAIYVTPEEVYVKGTNASSPEHMLDTFEIIDAATAQHYRHPHVRQED